LTVDVELDGSPSAAARARQALDTLSGSLAEPRLHDVRLLVSELVTNAVRHAGLASGDRIRLQAQLCGAVLRVEVFDPGTGFELRAPHPDPARTSGWGLYLVEELSDRWGIDGAGAGTRVWFELDAP
jgi:anti-sigma regulatory factor (Ser/Thr protein kinase)